jgi:hypothetical protein
MELAELISRLPEAEPHWMQRFRVTISGHLGLPVSDQQPNSSGLDRSHNLEKNDCLPRLLVRPSAARSKPTPLMGLTGRSKQ